MFELYRNNHGPEGSLAEIWIDKDARLIKKLYKPGGITVTGNVTTYRDLDVICSMYENEIRWSKKLKGEFVLEIYDHGEIADQTGYYIIQEYVGPDLLHYYDGKKLSGIEDPVGQIVDMFRFFKDSNVYKLNNAMSNLTNDSGKIRAFDFKYAVERSPEHRYLEEQSIDKWLSKIDSSLKQTLREFL